MLSASRAEDLGSISDFRRESFFRSSHTSDLQISTPEATLPGARGEIESLTCTFFLNVAARKLA